jgi:hypothetical protein
MAEPVLKNTFLGRCYPWFTAIFVWKFWFLAVSYVNIHHAKDFIDPFDKISKLKENIIYY